MQAKFRKNNGFSGTMSGNLNAKQKQISKKMLDLHDFDVQMLSPDFIASKTLKKPIKQYDINLSKTNPNGTRFQGAQKDTSQRSSSILQFTSRENNWTLQPEQQQQKTKFNFITVNDLEIKPAYQKKIQKTAPQTEIVDFELKDDKNSIISALLKKGDLKKQAPYEIKITKVEEKREERMGPAETKLKKLFNQNNSSNSILSAEVKNKKKQIIPSEMEIDEEIIESIKSQDEYGNEEFEKMSGAYESQIKQSIRESIGGSSGVIKESIKQSIRDQIPESFRSASKSREEVKQEIMQSRHKESIEQEVYQQIFEEASISDQIAKSKGNKNFKKQKDDDKLDLSASASRKFRTKTKTIQKSIKFAQELTIQNQIKQSDNKIQQKFEKGDKFAEQLIKQRAKFEKLQQKISLILDQNSLKPKKKTENKNLQLYYKFKIEINRLLTSENFMSKLRKLTAFIGANTNNKKGESVESLEDKLLSNLMERIHDLRVSGVTQEQLNKVKNQYNQKINYLLKEQEMSLRTEMDKKLHQKDLQLKKMIAQLQEKFKNRVPIGYSAIDPNRQGQKRQYGDRVQVDSDYSIDSNDISWKMDLWEVLPDYQKKKLYQKQSAEVAHFLTDILMNEIKDQNLDRSADISFQFPQQFNSSFETSSNQSKPKKSTLQSHEEMKPTIHREQLKKQLGKSQKAQIFPPLPGVKKNQSTSQQDHFQYNIHFMEIPLGKIPENQGVRDTLSVAEVVKILSKYKGAFLKKKNDLVRKLVKTLQQKTSENEPMSSLVNQIRIMNTKQITASDQPYVKAYQQDIIMELIAIYNKNKNRKSNSIEEQMKKMYERLVVTCQVKTAEASVSNPNQIIPSQTYIDYRMAQEDKKVKDILVNQICNILAAEFAKEMPKRKK